MNGFCKMQVKDSTLINGKGLFTTKAVKQDEVIFTLQGEILHHPTRESIHIGNGEHIDDEFGRFINHLFKPNTRIEGANVVAIRDIQANEELTFNYNDNEINMASPFYANGILVEGKKNI